jgi:hypothetical protein
MSQEEIHFTMPAATQHLFQTAISECINDNSPLLFYPSPNTTPCGQLKGRLGNASRFSSGKSVSVWKPSSSYSKTRNNDGESDIDITRVCVIRIKSPSKLIHKLWFDQHSARKKWDTTSCLDCEKTGSFVDANNNPTNIFWLLSQPRPMISAREFIYAYKEIPFQGKGKGRMYAGSSIKPDKVIDGISLEEFSSSRSDSVRKNAVQSYLQGMFRIEEVGKNVCDVTYCVRVKPNGSLPKSVAVLASNELMYTLFRLRERAETLFVAAKMKKRKRIAAEEKNTLTSKL